MKRLFICTLLIFIALYVAAQPPETEQPQRKPEEVAKKQTEMLVRELSICDSAKIDTLYRLHLKYARMRQRSNTRAEDLSRLQQLYAELEHILSKEQYERFMNHQLQGPRRPQTPLGRMPKMSACSIPSRQPIAEERTQVRQ